MTIGVTTLLQLSEEIVKPAGGSLPPEFSTFRLRKCNSEQGPAYMKVRDSQKRGRKVNVMLDFLIWLIKLPFILLVWLIKLPFVLVAVVLMVTLGLVGMIILLLGVCLIPVLGIGLLLLPIGLGFLLIAWLIAMLL